MLVKLLSKKAQTKFIGLNDAELLRDEILNSDHLSTKEKTMLTIIRESFKDYQYASILKTKIRSSQDAAEFAQKAIGNEDRENLIVLYLNTKNEVIDSRVEFIGTINSSVAHPREIFKSAVSLSAARIIIAHNHPSGDCEPSQADLQFTKRMIDAGDLMGIETLDHIIVSTEGWESLREITNLFN